MCSIYCRCVAQFTDGMHFRKAAEEMHPAKIKTKGVTNGILHLIREFSLLSLVCPGLGMSGFQGFSACVPAEVEQEIIYLETTRSLCTFLNP